MQILKIGLTELLSSQLGYHIVGEIDNLQFIAQITGYRIELFILTIGSLFPRIPMTVAIAAALDPVRVAHRRVYTEEQTRQEQYLC